MSTSGTIPVSPGVGTRAGLAVIDVDTHAGRSAHIVEYLPDRWREWLGQVGMRAGVSAAAQLPRHRPFAARLDAVLPGGGEPGSDPAFAREQHLDGYNITAAILNPLTGDAGGWEPAEFGRVYYRAVNEQMRDHWLTSDPRWYGSISVPTEQPEAAAAEIARCIEEGGRWAHVLLPTRTDRPVGNPRYWPVFEAAEHYGLPVAFHVGANRSSQVTACGWPSFYYEDHVGFAQQNFSLLPSMIFGGMLDRFPKLRIVLLELGWAWVPAFAWRLDAAYRVMRAEVPSLQRSPSEYVREHFWFSTQPIEEPEDPRWFGKLLEHVERFGLLDRLMYSSDYPHWDFDSPEEVLPATVSTDVRRKILGENASVLYRIQLLSEGGVEAAR